VRVAWSILPPPNGLPSTLSTANLDSDVIVSAVVLGFVGGRLSVGNPIHFSFESDADKEATQLAASRLGRAVSEHGRTSGRGLRDLPAGAITTGRTRGWKEGALVTGAPGSAASPFESRHAEPSGEAARELRERAASGSDPVGYQGSGAYTGFVDDPYGASTVNWTRRANVIEQRGGERWRPPNYEYREAGLTERDSPWGLLNRGLPIPDMFGETWVPGGIVGYTHGMVQAVYGAIAAGPWCTPFEIAVGKTTKLASCTMCSLFMYAAGYPPSAIHLGRGDSWLPFYPLDPGVDGYHAFLDEAIRSANTRWYLECRQHLERGCAILSGLPLEPPYAERVGRLQATLDGAPNDLRLAANLLLDAVTIADERSKFQDRIIRVLEPLG
jgi:hypothetical protein